MEEKSLNDFKSGTFIDGFASDGAVSMELKGLMLIRHGPRIVVSTVTCLIGFFGFRAY